MERAKAVHGLLLWFKKPPRGFTVSSLLCQQGLVPLISRDKIERDQTLSSVELFEFGETVGFRRTRIWWWLTGIHVLDLKSSFWPFSHFLQGTAPFACSINLDTATWRELEVSPNWDELFQRPKLSFAFFIPRPPKKRAEPTLQSSKARKSLEVTVAESNASGHSFVGGHGGQSWYSMGDFASGLLRRFCPIDLG